MIIKVTKEHIRKGIKRDPGFCPIACALRSRLDADDVTVGATEVWIGETEYRLPKSATHFVLEFDQGHPVKPFSFRITGLKST